MNATMWFLVLIQCIVWILLFLYLNLIAKDVNKIRKSLLELPHSIQDKQPAQRSFIEQHARNTAAIIKRAQSTGRWPEEQESKSVPAIYSCQDGGCGVL